MAFSDFLDPVLSPLLDMNSFLAIFLISLVITVIITFVYKYTTDQKKMKGLKEELKKIQRQIKEQKANPKKAMELQQRAMKLNMDFMKNSFKSTLYTILPIILIFGWLNSHMAYEQLSPGEPFEVTVYFEKYLKGNVTLGAVEDIVFETPASQELTIEENSLNWILKQENTGPNQLSIEFEGVSHSFPIIVTEERRYENPKIIVKDKPFTHILVGNKPIRPLDGFSLFGWHPGWLGTYIIFSIVLSTLLRKALKLV
ncbi:DUF106 domain-containing protein [Candidatus Woesearchaeota archaeon]|nr:DUF106 domain-containing protein [Candidatus Woesearchaeota archaeon]